MGMFHISINSMTLTLSHIIFIHFTLDTFIILFISLSHTKLNNSLIHFSPPSSQDPSVTTNTSRLCSISAKSTILPSVRLPFQPAVLLARHPGGNGT